MIPVFNIRLLLANLLLVLLIASNAVNADKDSAAELTYSEKGRYRVSMHAENDNVPIGQLHSWIVHVETSDGVVFIPTQLVINGGMPGHGHGLPSKPQISRYLENGNFLVEGMKFNMSGVWQFQIGLNGPDGPDQVLVEHTVRNHEESADNNQQSRWSVSEMSLMQSMALKNLSTNEADASNRFSQNFDAAALGRKLFFDPQLSSTGSVACSNCHKPDYKFADSERFSIGSARTGRNAPGLLGVAKHRWFYWDGRRDSLWSQAITPLETTGEMDNTRSNVVQYVLDHPDYGPAFRAIGGAAPDLSSFPRDAGPFGSTESKQRWQSMQPADREQLNRAFTDVGKVLAAYMETLHYSPSRFDQFVETLTAGNSVAANRILDSNEQKGLKLFLDAGRTLCLRCHNGPMFTNFGFHNIATGFDPSGRMDFGRMLGLQAAMVNEFNCMGQYSDTPRSTCDELIHAANEESHPGAFRVPGLRDVASTAPYMHDGRFASLSDVIEFYVQEKGPESGPSEINSVDLSPAEIEQLVAFLGALSGVE